MTTTGDSLVRLRPIQEGDLAQLHRWYQTPELSTHLVDDIPVRGEAEAVGFMRAWLKPDRANHRFAVVRATELRRWIDTGAYTAILGGDYPRRADDDTASVSAAAQEAAASYSDTFERTQDTLGKLVHDLAGWMGQASGWLNDRFRRGNDGDTA